MHQGAADAAPSAILRAVMATSPTAAARYRVAFSRISWVVVPLVFTSVALQHYAQDGSIARDFYVAYLPAAERLLEGASPFDTSPYAMRFARSFPYSAFDALMFVPWALIPTEAARWGFVALNITALFATLRLLEVRDVRLYGVVLLWPAVVTGWQTGNVTLLLGLGVAALWRYRDRSAITGLLVALLITVKLVVWPLAVWLLISRRWVGAAWAAGSGLALNIVAWAIVGFDEIDAYRTVVREVARYEELSAYSVPSLVLHVGGSRGLAYAVGLGAAGIALGICAAAVRDGRDAAGLSWALAAGMLATPVVWPHYFALLITPLVLAWPRLAWPWFVPLLLWLCPLREPRLSELLVGLGVLLALVVVSGRRRTPVTRAIA